MPSPEELERQAREFSKSQPPSILEQLIKSGDIHVRIMPTMGYSDDCMKLVRTQEIPRVEIQEG